MAAAAAAAFLQIWLFPSSTLVAEFSFGATLMSSASTLSPSASVNLHILYSDAGLAAESD